MHFYALLHFCTLILFSWLFDFCMHRCAFIYGCICMYFYAPIHCCAPIKSNTLMHLLGTYTCMQRC